jgi:hypothetical protein
MRTLTEEKEEKESSWLTKRAKKKAGRRRQIKR